MSVALITPFANFLIVAAAVIVVAAAVVAVAARYASMLRDLIQ